MITFLTLIIALGLASFISILGASIIDTYKSDIVFREFTKNSYQFQNIGNQVIRFAFKKSAEL